MASEDPRAPTVRFSVIFIVYNMQRAAPRALTSLVPPYQQGLATDDYEILVIENGSDAPLNRLQIESIAPNVQYLSLSDPPPSPGYAINLGAAQARGEILCIMVDGAHMLTPGVFSYALDMFQCRPEPIVLTPPFFLGPGAQMQTIQQGYDEAEEDRLLASIAWPTDGYRLFEIGEPYRLFLDPARRPKLFWLVRMFESNCMFVRKRTFDRVHGCDLRFDLPGGGLLMPDLYKRLASLEQTEIVQLIGEASFHQLHGGVSTNTTLDNQKAEWQRYSRQYEQIRGAPFEVTKKPIRYYGHMASQRAMTLMKTG